MTWGLGEKVRYYYVLCISLENPMMMGMREVDMGLRWVVGDERVGWFHLACVLQDGLFQWRDQWDRGLR